MTGFARAWAAFWIALAMLAALAVLKAGGLQALEGAD